MLRMNDGRSILKAMLTLAVPISLQNLIAFAVNFADNLMIGSLGDTAISAVYMATQVQVTLQMLVGGISAAMLILVSQYWGRQDVPRIRLIAALGARLALMVGVVLTFIAVVYPQWVLSLLTTNAQVVAEGISYLRIVGCSYLFFCTSQVLISLLRGVENAKVGMFISFGALLMNVFLNWVMIFGKIGFPAMGIVGAAIATLIARIIEAIAVIFYTFRLEKMLKLKLSHFFARSRELTKDFFRYGLPVIAGEAIWGFNLFMQSYIQGRFSQEAIAAVSIMSMMANLVYVWVTGLCAAVGILTGKLVGSGETEKIRPYAKTVQLMFLGVGIVSGLIVFLARYPFISLYNISEATAQYAVQLLTLLSVTIVGTCYQMTGLAGLVKAGGDTSFVFKNDTIFIFCVLLPSAFLALHWNAPLWVVVACLKCDQILKCFVAAVKINRFKWMKNLTRTSVPVSTDA